MSGSCCWVFMAQVRAPCTLSDAEVDAVRAVPHCLQGAQAIQCTLAYAHTFASPALSESSCSEYGRSLKSFLSPAARQSPFVSLQLLRLSNHVNGICHATVLIAMATHQHEALHLASPSGRCE